MRFHSEAAVELLMQDIDLSSVLIDPDDAIEHYNQHCRQHNKDDYLIAAVPEPVQAPAEDTARRIETWLIPSVYQTLPVRQRLLAMCSSPAEIARVNLEMDLFEQRDMLPILRLMFFLVTEFRRRGVVWGVGRGSSVASYCLFLIGVHKCNSLAYDLDIHEFLR